MNDTTKTPPTDIPQPPIPTIFVVTPSFNAADTILRTLLSVVQQGGRFRLRYHVQDGGSTDSTVAVLKSFQERLRRKEIDTFCEAVEFSYTSVKDKGMYDAICRAFESLPGDPVNWLGWINADDTLAPGALTLLSVVDAQLPNEGVDWITGTTCVAWDDLIVGWGDRPLSSDVLAEGLADGEHWSFLQQEGTFFRRRLWDAIEPRKHFASFKLAGDWNLWRVMAKKARIYQVGWAMGAFNRREGQLSGKHRNSYLDEIDRTIPKAERTNRLLGLRDRKVQRDMLKTKYADRTVRIDRFPMSLHPWIDQALAAQKKPTILKSPGMVAYDSDWQFPAVTEHHAYKQAQKLLAPLDGTCYFAFPWATLIDHLQSGGPRANELKGALLSLKEALAPYKTVVTVCQHIYLHRYIGLLEDVGVTDVYWSHASIGQKSLGTRKSVRVRPFPLYPVQVPAYVADKGESPRKHLFSFVGAKASEAYLTKVRDLIVVELGSDPRGFVRSRDSWHYEKVVYQHQILGTAAKPDGLVDADRSAEFKRLLRESTFSLCPSGSGPNSIRLWESLGVGSIPVILADTYLPPGDPALWAAATVICREDAAALRELPGRLEALARDPAALRAMRHAGHQLWLLYGPDCFVYDIQMLYTDLRAQRLAPAAAQAIAAAVPAKVAPAAAVAAVAPAATPAGNGLPNLLSLAERLGTGTDQPHERRIFVVSCSTRILQDAAGFAKACAKHPKLREVLKRELAQPQLAGVAVCRAVIERRAAQWPDLKALIA